MPEDKGKKEPRLTSKINAIDGILVTQGASPTVEGNLIMASLRSIQTIAQHRFTKVNLYLLLFLQLQVYLSFRWLSQSKCS